MTEKDKKTIFDLPNDALLSDAIDDILARNGTEETPDEYLSKAEQEEETKLIVIRDAALVLWKKEIPEEKTVEILARHLETSLEVAQKVVADIKEKLVPYIKTVTIEEERPRVAAPKAPQPAPPVGVKTPEIAEVEKNAEAVQRAREEANRAASAFEKAQQQRRELGQEPKEAPTAPPPPRKEDKYREPLA